jgi:hypothetical protein
MKKLAILSAAVGLFCGLPLSVEWSQTDGPAVSVNSAEARVGRPRTATSVAGVARRTTRRTVRRTAVRRAIIYCTAPGVPVGCVYR